MGFPLEIEDLHTYSRSLISYSLVVIGVVLEKGLESQMVERCENSMRGTELAETFARQASFLGFRASFGSEAP